VRLGPCNFLRRFTYVRDTLCAVRLRFNSMTYDDLIDLLADSGIADPKRFLHAVYHGLKTAYRFNQARFDDQHGDDEGLFGFSVYKNGWFHVEAEIAKLDGSEWTDRPQNSLTIFAGRRRMKVYRGGPDEKFDIQSFDPLSGSPTKVGLAHGNAKQISLFEQDGSTIEPHDLDDWFFVHTGNSSSGLAGVWLGAPTVPSLENGMSSWAFVVHLPNLCDEFGCGEGLGGVSLAQSPDLRPSSPSHDQLTEPTIKVTLKQIPNLPAESQ
jgi:hypothetical protein